MLFSRIIHFDDMFIKLLCNKPSIRSTRGLSLHCNFDSGPSDILMPSSLVISNITASSVVPISITPPIHIEIPNVSN